VLTLDELGRLSPSQDASDRVDQQEACLSSDGRLWSGSGTTQAIEYRAQRAPLSAGVGLDFWHYFLGRFIQLAMMNPQKTTNAMTARVSFST
jgi:hypothetical protein